MATSFSLHSTVGTDRSAVKSDGKRITFGATLNDPPGAFATSVVNLYIDADNNPATGIKGMRDEPGGFEYEAELYMCVKYENGGMACSGSAGERAESRFGAVDLKRFKGESKYGDSEDVLDAMGFPGRKPAVQVPLKGRVVEGSIEYADIYAQPGQTLRVLARESGGSPKDDGYFPIVLLTRRGRDAGHPAPPAQIPASGTTALGSWLGS